MSSSGSARSRPRGHTASASCSRTSRRASRRSSERRFSARCFLTGAPVFLSFGLWNVLLLPFALKALHATEFEYGIQEAVTSVGFVVGSLMMARFADRFARALDRRGDVAMGIGGVLYGLATSIEVAMVLVTYRLLQRPDVDRAAGHHPAGDAARAPRPRLLRVLPWPAT